jgi:Papain family cysteine protease
MKHLLFCIFCFLTPMLFAQERFTGLLFDENVYNALPQMPVVGMGFESPNLPIAYNIKKYAPTPGNQGGIGSCVGWALGYGAQTIEYAKQRNMTNKTAITQAAFSGMYIYNYVKVNSRSRSCDGSYPETALHFAKTRGNVKFADYNPDNCQETPNSYLDSKAVQNRIKDFVPMFQTNDSKERKLAFIKNAIASDKPVIICMKLTKNFCCLKEDTWIPAYDPDPNWLHAHHAMVVVGYNDNEGKIELMNSWGTDWGNGGFIKINYSDFMEYLRAAYQIILKDLPNEKVSLSGTFDFRYSINVSGKPMGDATTNFNPTKDYYELTKKDWQQGQRFQLVVNSSLKGQYLYVFSINSAYNATVHFPLGRSYGSTVSLDNSDLDGTDIVPIKTEFIIPQPLRGLDGTITKEQSFKINPTGTDYLVILYASESLKGELNQIVEATRQSVANGNTPRQALQNTLQNRLMTVSDIQYASQKAAFTANSYLGKIAPLIIRVDSK